MPNFIAHTFAPLVRLLLPRQGRHRPGDERAMVTHQEVEAWAPRRIPAHGPVLLRGEDAALIRPYVRTPEEWQKRRLQRAPWLAVQGADAGLRWIRGVGVAGW
ncbi:hypothetical protein [Streptomyces sp. CA2R101]|uniref:hypothetical protein n=1 Tax=Streptomyces sp. CA2R101 TaxID=3120152 RepID=UPI00300A6099